MTNKKTAEAFASLENDKSFKYSHIPFSCKWKSWLYVGPVLLLFMSLFSMLFLLKNNLLASWYVVPYIVVFVVATVWFKAVRKYLSRQLMDSPGNFITAFAKPVLTDEYKVYALFSVGANRHNQNFIDHQASLITSEYADLIPQLKPGRALPLLSGNESESDYLYLCCLRKFSVRKLNIGWDEESAFPLLLIAKKYAKNISA